VREGEGKHTPLHQHAQYDCYPLLERVNIVS